MFCHEFILADLRVYDNCAKVCKGCEHVFNLAADMGGMGFIQSNHGVIFYNNTMISFNMLEAARKEGVKRCVPRAAGCPPAKHVLTPRNPRFRGHTQLLLRQQRVRVPGVRADHHRPVGWLEGEGCLARSGTCSLDTMFAVTVHESMS
jgi:NAD dependent epimerase/dehydratase family